MIAFEIPGPPVAFARAGANGGRRFTPAKQRNYGQLIKLRAAEIMGDRAPFAGPVIVSIRAVYVMPTSWPKKRRDAAVWKTSKPDVDNLIKLAKDAMTGIVYRDDAQVVSVSGQKRYGIREHMIVEVSEA